MLLKHLKISREVSVIVYLFFVAVCLPALSYGQSDKVDSEISKAYHQILALRLETGRATLNQIDNYDKTEKGFLIYALNLADILELLLNEDPELYKEKKPLEKERLTRIEELSDSDPWKQFCEAEIKLQWAFVKLKYGDELGAIWSLNQSYKAVSANSELFPSFLPNKKTSAIFNIIFGAVPQKHQWLLKFFSMSGSTEHGIEELEDLSFSEDILALESHILLLLTRAYLMDEANIAILGLKKLARDYNENKLIKYLLGITLLKNSQAENALEAIKQTDNLTSPYAPIIYSEYLKGEIMLQMGKYSHASAQYASFILKYKGSNFIKDAYYKLFLANYLSGDESEAQFFLKKAKTSGTTIAEADKYAEKQIIGDLWPNKDIMKIRLATDGGFYETADSLIQQFSVEDFELQKDQVEYIYRKARLFDKRKITDKALVQYQLTIENAGNNNWYFAPNAALQLGYIYAEKGQKEEAKMWLEKALSYKDYEYKNSIDNKAEAALQKLK